MSRFQQKEAIQIKEFIDKEARFMFIPSVALVTLVAQNEHPYVKALPKVFKYIFLQNKPIRIEGKMALDYYEGTLDNRNTFLLDKGDIKVIPERIEIN